MGNESGVRLVADHMERLSLPEPFFFYCPSVSADAVVLTTSSLERNSQVTSSLSFSPYVDGFRMSPAIRYSFFFSFVLNNFGREKPVQSLMGFGGGNRSEMIWSRRLERPSPTPTYGDEGPRYFLVWETCFKSSTSLIGQSQLNA